MKKSFSPLFSLLVLICIFSGCSSESSQPKAVDDSTLYAKTVVGGITINIHEAEGKTDSYPDVVIGNESNTVRDVMLRAATAYPEFTFTDTLYTGMGHLLTSLMGIRNASGGGKYWQFCIDNVGSDRGIDEKQLAAGQSLDWYFVDYGKLPCKKIGE